MSAPATVGQALARARRSLQAAAIPNAALDARVLIGHALALTPTDLIAHPERPLTDACQRRIEAMIGRRLAREPVAYITGQREFWSLPLSVTAAALIPRPESETLIEAVLSDIGDRSAAWRILDLGTGSGCLALALLRELANATAVAVDRSIAALHLARTNAVALNLANRLHLVASDWASAVGGPFDIIVANPPYVPTAAWAELAPEVRLFEPRAALIGGGDGLASYRQIIFDLARILAPQASVCFECGHDQGGRLANLFRDHGFTRVAVRCDLAGRQRCVCATFPSQRRKKCLE